MPNNQQVATRRPTAFEAELASYEPQFAAALPSHISVERFKRVLITSLNQNAELANADRRSLFTACVRAAQDGLLPDGKEAALVVFNSKDRKTGEWRKNVSFMPMIAGIYKRMRNSGEVAAISSYVVFTNDKFEYELGDEPRIKHIPTLGERGQPIAVYAIAKLTNGEVLREVLSVAEVEKVRAVSRSKDEGPWVQWWEEMARKVATRRLAKRLPGSADIDDMLNREDEQYRPQPNGAAVPAARPTRAMFNRLPQPISIPDDDDEPGYDTETGEVNDPFGISLPTQEQKSLIEQGDEVCERGVDALQVWWRLLTSAQRGELGARGRAVGPYLEGWKVRAIAADERGGPAPEEELEPGPEQEAEPPPRLDLPPLPPQRNDGTINWTKWALDMVESIRDASGESLEALGDVRDMYTKTCPTLVMLDIDRAYVARLAELEGTM